MKKKHHLKLSFILFAFLLSYHAFSQQQFALNFQNDEEVSDDNGYNAAYAGFDFGFMTTNRTDEWENEVFRSTNLNWNLIEHKFPIFRQYIGLTTGLSFNLRQMRFDSNYSLVSMSDTTMLQTGNPHLYDPNATVNTSVFNYGYFQVPLLLDFAAKQRQKKSFYLAAGVVGGIRLYGYHRQSGTYSNGDNFQNEIRNKGAFNSNLFTLEGMVRIGYGAFGLFGTYRLNSLFKETATQAINPITIGISLNVDYGGDDPIEEDEEIDFDSIDF